MNTLCFWSGGKDSTASIILAHIHHLPITEIVFFEVMFDKSRNISGEIPEHIDFIRNIAIPIFEEWGYKIKILHADCDYMDLFFHTVTRSKTEENNGKHSGWLIGGRCAGNDRLKMKPIRQYRKSIEGEYIEYVGIAADEPKRLERLTDNKRSLLYEYHCTEEMAYELCKNYGLLSPIYSFTRRNGCWFCPNQSYNELAHLKFLHPELWEELKVLSCVPDLVSRGFRYGVPFDEVEERIDKIITENWGLLHT